MAHWPRVVSGVHAYRQAQRDVSNVHGLYKEGSLGHENDQDECMLLQRAHKRGVVTSIYKEGLTMAFEYRLCTIRAV